MVSESEPEDDTMLCHAIADAKSLFPAETKEKDAGGVKPSLSLPCRRIELRLMRFSCSEELFRSSRLDIIGLAMYSAML